MTSVIWTSADPFIAARLRQTAMVRGGEVAMTRTVTRAMELWLAAARKAIYGHPNALATAATDTRALTADTGDATASRGPDQNDALPNLNLWPDLATWQVMVDTVVIPEVTKLFGKAFAEAIRNADIQDTHYVDAYVATVSDRLSENLWPEYVFGQVREVIADGIRDGLSITHITEELSKTLDVAHYEWQARRIARTETMGAVNGGTWNGASAYAELTGLNMFKQWFATMDRRTRLDHSRAHDQVVPIATDFVVGGYLMAFPAAPDGPAEEVCNCRCTLLVLSEAEAANWINTADWADNPGDESAADVQDVLTEADLGRQNTTILPEDLVPAVTGSAIAFAPAPVIAPGSTPPVVAPPDNSGSGVGTWYGVLAPVDTPSADGRMIATPSDGQPRTRPLPLPILYQDNLASGHDGAFQVGLIQHAWIQDGCLMGAGTFDMDDPRAAAIAKKVQSGNAGWISVDLDDTTMEFEAADDGDGDEGHGLAVASDWRLMSATLVSQPAFPEAKIRTGQPGDEIPADGAHEIADDGAHAARAAQAFGADAAADTDADEDGEWCDDPDCEYCGLPYEPPVLDDADDGAVDEACDEGEGCTSCAAEDDEAFGRAGVPHPHRGHPGKRGARGTAKPTSKGTGRRGHRAAKGEGKTRGHRATGTGKGTKAAPHKGATGPVTPKSKAAPVLKPLPLPTLPPLPLSHRRSPVPSPYAALFTVLHPDTGMPVAPTTTAWDGAGAAKRVADYAKGADGKITPAKYGKAFLYRDDSADPANVTAYKLGYADLIDGRLTIVPKGVYAVAGALSGARTPLDVPPAQKDALKSAVERLYGRIASATGDKTITAPWKDGDGKPKSAAAARVSVAHFARSRPSAHDAGTGTFAPPRDWFEDPQLDGPTGITITDDGRVYGHLATWGVCHTGIPNKCVTAPKSKSGYAYFHLGTVRCDDGDDVAVGTLHYATDHADTRQNLPTAQRHYADTGCAGAVVRAGEDEYGIWVAGSVLPGADIVTLRHAPLSGDWRSVGGAMELVGALCVNQPGFPVPRPRWSTDDQQKTYALCAAGALPPTAGEAECCDCGDCGTCTDCAGADGAPDVLDVFVTKLADRLAERMSADGADATRARRFAAAMETLGIPARKRDAAPRTPNRSERVRALMASMKKAGA